MILGITSTERCGPWVVRGPGVPKLDRGPAVLQRGDARRRPLLVGVRAATIKPLEPDRPNLRAPSNRRMSHQRERMTPDFKGREFSLVNDSVSRWTELRSLGECCGKPAESLTVSNLLDRELWPA